MTGLSAFLVSAWQRPYRSHLTSHALWLGLLLSCFRLLLPLPVWAVADRPITLNANDPIPIMAYYYIWFDTNSWRRAKTDYPLLGRYSSDDRAVMERHVRWAKEVGIDGFIVSWKSTSTLDSRLEQLMDVARDHGFALWIIYQGLDFERNPLPIERIEQDLDYFSEAYGDHPAFKMFNKPVVIWSGTWEFSTEDIAYVTQAHRSRLNILASERNLEAYERLAHLVDGNAYYWSSVNPDTYPRYPEKLTEMGRSVHAHGGLWVAPAAPGFDARLIGGTTVVERKSGAMLRRQLSTALRSSPDAIGLISWNEFSENSHIEPSEKFGHQALEVLSGREVSKVPFIPDFDSSAPGTTKPNEFYGVYVLIGTAIFVGACLLLLFARIRHNHSHELEGR